MIKGSNHIIGYLIYEGSYVVWYLVSILVHFGPNLNLCAIDTNDRFSSCWVDHHRSVNCLWWWMSSCAEKRTGDSVSFSLQGESSGGLCTELRLFIIFIVVVSGIIPILDGHCHQKLCIILFPFSPLHLGFSHCHKLFILQRTLFLCTLHTFRFPFSQRLRLLYRSIHLKCSFRNVHTFIL